MDVDGDDEEVIDKSSREYQSQFGLPEDELVRDYFNCALQKGILHQGKMYISQHFLCFYSNILLSEAKVVIRADKISSVEPAKILIFPTAIRVTTNDGSEYLFASFLQRDQALQLIEKIMRGERIGKQRVKLPSELDSQASSSRSRPSAAIDKPKHLQLLEQREKKIKASKNEEANAIKYKENDRGTGRNKGTSSASSSRKNSEDDLSAMAPKSKPAAAAVSSAKKKGKGELVFEEEVDHVDSTSDDKRRRSFDDDDDDDDRPRKGKSNKSNKKKSRRQADDDDDDRDPMDDDDDDRHRRRKSDSDDRRHHRREGEEEAEEDDRTPPRRKNKNGTSARKRRDDDSDDTRDSRDVSEDEAERELRLEREEREARKQKKPAGKSSELDVPTSKKKPPLHPVERSQSRSNQTATPSRSPLATPQRTPDVSDDERGQTKKKNSNTLKHPSSSPPLKPAKPSSAPGSAAASDLESDAEYDMRRTRRQAAVLDDETRQVNSEFKRFSCSIFDPFVTHKLPDPRVTKINSRFKGLSQSLDTRNRRLVYEGFIKRQGKFSVVDRWCFLFTDCLIFAEIIPPEEGKNGEQMYKLKQMIELSKMHIDARPVEQQKASNTAPSSSSSSASGGSAAALKEQANAAWENEAFGSGFDLIKSTKIPNPIRIIAHVPENVTYVVGFTNRVERLRWLDWLQFAIARNMRAMKSPHIFAPGSSNAQAEGWWLKIIKGSVHRAAFEGDVGMLSTLLKNDSSLLNSTLDLADGFTPLHYVVQGNRIEALEFLCSFPDLDLRECDSQNINPIHLAVKLGRIECLQILLAECAKRSIDYTVFHPVPYSTKQLTSDFALRGKNLRELSAVWSCALGSHRDWAIMFRMLIKFVKDHKPQHHHHHHYMQPSYSVLNERDQQGHTLLEECVLGGLEELLPVLIQNGAAIDLPNSDGLTPLGLSASFSNEPFVRFLLQLGAQPNIRSKPSLQAPGHQCVDRSTAILLIRHGARYRMASAEGKKLVDLFDEDDEKQQEQLDAAIEASENDRPILITKQKLNIPAGNLAFQGMTTCEICCDEFSKTSSHRKKELCGKCNKVICAACSSPKLAFPLTKNVAKARPVPIQLPSTSAAGGSAAFAPIAKKDEKNEVARVCDGCYNALFYHTVNVRKETVRLEIERERRKKAAAERLAKHGGKIPTKNPSSVAAAKKKQAEKAKKQKKSSKGKGKKRDTDDDDDDDHSHTDSDGSDRSDNDDDDDGSDIECNSSTTTSGSDDDAELAELNDELELDEGDIYRGPEARRDNPSNSAAAIASKAVISATTGLLGLVGVNIKPSKHGGDEEQGGLVETATGALNKLGSMLTSVHVSQARKTTAREISTAHGTVVISDDKGLHLPDGARFRHVRTGSLAQNGLDGPAMAIRAGAVPVDGSPMPRRSPTLTPTGVARTVPNLKTRSNNSSPAPREQDSEPENHKKSAGGGMIALAFKPRRQKSIRGRRVDDDDDDDAEEEEEKPTKSSRAAAAAAKNRRKSRGDTDDDDDDDDD